MESVIVNKFYSKFEKLGLKQHKSTNDELDFLSKMGDLEQCDAFLDEYDYNISKVTENSRFALRTSIFIFVLLLVTFIIDFTVLRSAVFGVFLMVMSFFYFRFEREKRILRISKNFIKTMRETIVKEMFK